MAEKTNPRNKRDKQRTSCATFLLYEDEKALFVEVAQSKGMTLSAFIRMVLLDYINGSK